MAVAAAIVARIPKMLSNLRPNLASDLRKKLKEEAPDNKYIVQDFTLPMLRCAQKQDLDLYDNLCNNIIERLNDDKYLVLLQNNVITRDFVQTVFMKNKAEINKEFQGQWVCLRKSFQYYSFNTHSHEINLSNLVNAMTGVECPICCEPLDTDAEGCENVANPLTCSHQFHKNCLSHYIKTKADESEKCTCPICRTLIYDFRPTLNLSKCRVHVMTLLKSGEELMDFYAYVKDEHRTWPICLMFGMSCEEWPDTDPEPDSVELLDLLQAVWEKHTQ